MDRRLLTESVRHRVRFYRQETPNGERRRVMTRWTPLGVSSSRTTMPRFIFDQIVIKDSTYGQETPTESVRHRVRFYRQETPDGVWRRRLGWVL